MRYISRFFLIVMILPLFYLFASLILGLIGVNNSNIKTEKVNPHTVYLSTNGVHLNIILEKNDLSEELREGLVCSETDKYFAIGWGDEAFYLNTPNWSDLTFKTAFNAVFLKGSTLIHIDRYAGKKNGWVKIEVTQSELDNINALILNYFRTDKNGQKILLKGKGYTVSDNFYEAQGSYSCFRTCNTWVNTIFKKSGLKACIWTPFDFSLINKYR